MAYIQNAHATLDSAWDTFQFVDRRPKSFP
jgi:hypothetical protein